MITFRIFIQPTHVLSGIPSLDVAVSIARDVFRYNWLGDGWTIDLDDRLDSQATHLPVEIIPDEESPEVLVVWLHMPSRRVQVASILSEHRCPTCRRAV